MSVHSFFPLLPSLTLPYPLPLLVASCRKDKVLSVITAEGEESVVFYEYLLFANGTQYIREQDPGQVAPLGVLILNSVEDEEEFGKWAEELLAGGKGTRLLSGCLFVCLSVCLSGCLVVWLCACVLIHLCHPSCRQGCCVRWEPCGVHSSGGTASAWSEGEGHHPGAPFPSSLLQQPLCRGESGTGAGAGWYALCCTCVRRGGIPVLSLCRNH